MYVFFGLERCNPRASSRFVFGNYCPRHLFTAAQLEVQLCGLARVELAFLRRHTMYLAGLQEEDPHIRLFWSVLAGFTQDQLGRLVKFACNQVLSS